MLDMFSIIIWTHARNAYKTHKSKKMMIFGPSFIQFFPLLFSFVFFPFIFIILARRWKRIWTEQQTLPCISFWPSFVWLCLMNKTRNLTIGHKHTGKRQNMKSTNFEINRQFSIRFFRFHSPFFFRLIQSGFQLLYFFFDRRNENDREAVFDR